MLCSRQILTHYVPTYLNKSVQRSSQSIQRLRLITSLVYINTLAIILNLMDFKLILKVLLSEKVFKCEPGRKHATFANIDADPLFGIKKTIKDFHKWLRQHRKEAAIEQALSLHSY